MTITLKAKHVYGNKVYYPACEKAEEFAKLIEAKTFQYRHMESIKRLGYQIVMIGE